MARFSDTVTDQSSPPRPVGGALILVRPTASNALAVLHDDSGYSLPNPVTSDRFGSYSFNAVDGRYDLTFSYLGRILSQENGVLVGVNPGADLSGLTTSNLLEGVNLYFSPSRARQAITSSATASYDPTSGVISLTKANIESALGYTAPQIVGSATASVTGGVVSITRANVEGAFGYALPQIVGSSSATVTGGVVTITSANVTAALGAPALTKTGGILTGPLFAASNPVDPLGVATKQYVDNVAQGYQPKSPVAAASTGNISSLYGTQTIDGVVLVVGNRVLVKDQSDATQNGIYVVASTAWARATDMDSWNEVQGATVLVKGGTVNANASYAATGASGGTIGATAISFAQISSPSSYSATGGIAQSGTQFSLTPIATGSVLANTSGSPAAPTSLALTALPISTATQTALDLKFDKAGGSVSGNITISRTSSGGGGGLVVLGPAGSDRALYFGDVTSSNLRWYMGANGAAESGANAGSDFFLNRVADNGSLIDTPLFVSRATGMTTIPSLAYQPPGSGSPVRSTSAKLSDLVSLKDFGAVSDGVTDDTAAWQRMRDYVNGTNGARVNLGAGTTVLNTQIVFTKSVNLLGAGIRVTNVLLKTGAGIATNYNSDDDYASQNFTAEGFMLLADGANATYPALSLTCTANTGGTGPEATLRDLGFSGKNSTSGFGTCVLANGVSNIHMDHLFFQGDRGNTSSARVSALAFDIEIASGSVKADIDISRCFFFFMKGCGKIRGHFEGVKIHGCTAVAVWDFLDWQAPSGDIVTLLQAHGNHFNCERSVFYCLGVVMCDIAHNNFYNNNLDGTITGNYTGITIGASLSQSMQAMIANNAFFLSGNASSVAGCVAISISTGDSTKTTCVVEGNQFRAVAQSGKQFAGVVLSTGTSGCFVSRSNIFDGFTTNVANAGSSNLIEGAYTYAAGSLPAASDWGGYRILIAGQSSYAFGQAAASGGTSTVSFFSDGTTWRQG